MTDEEILERWRRAEEELARANELEMLEAYIARVEAEGLAIARFGVGRHKDAYEARYGQGRAK